MSPKQSIANLSLLLKSKINLWALAFCGLSSGFWMVLLAKRYYYFIFGTGMDPAIYAQNLWELSHGSFYQSLLGANFIVNHCNFLCFLLVPIYWVCPEPLLLSYLQTWGFFSGAYIFFLILKKYLHPFIALGAMIAFTIAPANIGMLHFVFNYEPFSIPLVFLIFKAFDENKYLQFLICCFLLAMIKEQMPLVVAMFGVLGLMFKKEKKFKWGWFPLLMGLTIFILEVFVLTPLIRSHLPVVQSKHWMRYTQFGHSPHEILLFVLTHPFKMLIQFVSPANIHWYHDLFGIWGGLSFLSPQILLPAFPLFLKTMLSNDPQEHVVLSFYYASTFTPFIYIATWNTLNQIKNKWRLPIHTLALCLMFIDAFVYIPVWRPYLYTPITNMAMARECLIEKIPPRASVLSGFTTLAPLANREKLYTLRSYLEDQYYISELKFKIPDNTDYLLIDFANEATLNNNLKIYIPKMTALNFDNRWKLQESIEDMALYVKNPSRQKTFRLIDKYVGADLVSSQGTTIRPQNFDNTISLEGIEFTPQFPSKYRIFPVTMYWKCLKQTNISYKILVNITSLNGKSYYTKKRTIGSTIYPTDFWKKGEYIKESYFYLLPPMPRGNFIINISVYNPVNKKWVWVLRHCEEA